MPLCEALRFSKHPTLYAFTRPASPLWNSFAIIGQKCCVSSFSIFRSIYFAMLCINSIWITDSPIKISLCLWWNVAWIQNPYTNMLIHLFIKCKTHHTWTCNNISILETVQSYINIWAWARMLHRRYIIIPFHKHLPHTHTIYEYSTYVYYRLSMYIYGLFWLEPKYSIIFFAYVTTTSYSTQQADTQPDGKIVSEFPNPKKCVRILFTILCRLVWIRYWADAN